MQLQMKSELFNYHDYDGKMCTNERITSSTCTSQHRVRIKHRMAHWTWKTKVEGEITFPLHLKRKVYCSSLGRETERTPLHVVEDRPPPLTGTWMTAHGLDADKRRSSFYHRIFYSANWIKKQKWCCTQHYPHVSPKNDAAKERQEDFLQHRGKMMITWLQKTTGKVAGVKTMRFAKNVSQVNSKT